MSGGTTCRVHGGSAPQVRAAAQRRLQAMAEAAARRLGDFAFEADIPPAVALAAVNSILDRNGLSPKHAVEVEHSVKPYESIIANITGVAQMSRAESRAARGVPDDTPQQPALPAADDSPIDAEVVPDPAPERPDYGAVRPGDERTPAPAPQRSGTALLTAEAAAEEMAADRARWSGTRRIRSRRG